MAAGKPVIGAAEGGLLETVVDGQTGVLIPQNFSVEDLSKAVRSIDRRSSVAMRGACEDRADLFRKERFLEQMSAILTASRSV